MAVIWHGFNVLQQYMVRIPVRDTYVHRFESRAMTSLFLNWLCLFEYDLWIDFENDLFEYVLCWIKLFIRSDSALIVVRQRMEPFFKMRTLS